MQEVDINKLVYENNKLIKNIPNDIILVGKIDRLIIEYKYNELNLSKVDCYGIDYYHQEEESIKNHILPNSLIRLYCSYNKLTSLPDLPNSLEELLCIGNQLISPLKLPNSLIRLYCSYNKLTLLPNLPNSLKELRCFGNQLKSLPKLTDSLQVLNCFNNQLTSLPPLPNSLKELYCCNNYLKSLPDLPNSLRELSCFNNRLISLPNLNMLTSFKGDNKVDYIDYDPNYEESKIKFSVYYDGNELVNSYIEIKDHGKVTSRKEYIQYMEKIKLSKIKSARK